MENIYYYKIGILLLNGKVKYYPELTSELMTKKEAEYWSDKKIKEMIKSGWHDVMGNELLVATIIDNDRDEIEEDSDDDEEYGICTPSNSFIEQFM